jgi:hypothetical protein
MTMGFVRGGPRYGVQHLSTGLNEFVRHVRRAPESEATRYAEALGVANDAIQSQTLYARASMDQVGNTVAQDHRSLPPRDPAEAVDGRHADRRDEDRASASSPILRRISRARTRR